MGTEYSITFRESCRSEVSRANDRCKSHGGHFPIRMPPTAKAENVTVRNSAKAVIGMIHKLRSFPDPKRSLMLAQINCKADPEIQTYTTDPLKPLKVRNKLVRREGIEPSTFTLSRQHGQYEFFSHLGWNFHQAPQERYSAPNTCHKTKNNGV